MTVIREARKIIEENIHLDEITVEKIVVGMGYTGVKLSNDDAGVCHSLMAEAGPGGCGIFDKAGTLTELPLETLIGYTDSWVLYERVIGLSTLNALSQTYLKEKEASVLRENLVDIVRVEASDNVVIVGAIKPFIKHVKPKAARLAVLERSHSMEPGYYPDTACEELVPEADVVIITGSTLANGTIDRLLELSEGARLVAVVGPTASIVPEPLFNRGVSYSGGIRIDDAEKLMTILAEAGGTPQMKRAGTLVTYVNPKLG